MTILSLFPQQVVRLNVGKRPEDVPLDPGILLFQGTNQFLHLSSL